MVKGGKLCLCIVFGTTAKLIYYKNAVLHEQIGVINYVSNSPSQNKDDMIYMFGSWHNPGFIERQ